MSARNRNKKTVETAVHGIGSRLRARRLELGLSQYRLAELSGISREMIRRIESGLSVPTLYVFVVVCLSLEVEPKDVIDFKLEDLQTDEEK